MKPKNKQRLILALIKDHLINTKLINTLNQIGVQADDYYLHLSESIFKLIGIKNTRETEPIFEHYFNLLGRVDNVDIVRDKEQLNKLACDIYSELLLVKPA